MTTTARRYIGPPLLLPATSYVALFVASLALGGAVGAFSTPTTSAADVVAHALDHPGAAQFVSVIQLGAAVALGVFTATTTSAVAARGIDVAGLQIARLGGYGASILLAMSAVCGWCTVELAQIGATDAAKATSLLAFATGGPAHVVFLGLLLAGISVPTLIAGLVPRWISILGLVLAGVAALSSLSFAISPLQFLLPIVRFPSMIWILAIAATLLSHTDNESR
ncbi:hypothetical protein [Antrihabitans cavernicola]|uniref:DUF4386 domain-containing protein n=1 Tax=Antrihabitans cavernicola TaxID=2495913 RepID=A0A5A7SA32_9NOCA|nr:hypothetical protein [Spelaeibacter cavernicola]KAA0022042.1 hypothetical protein FOY51_16840 [Spelaeibacter cavernicola]